MKITVKLILSLILTSLIISCSENTGIMYIKDYGQYASFTVKSVDSTGGYYHPLEKVVATDTTWDGWLMGYDGDNEDSVWVIKFCSYFLDTIRPTCDHINIVFSKFEDKSKLVYDTVTKNWEYPFAINEVNEFYNKPDEISVYFNHCYAVSFFISGKGENYAVIEAINLIDYKGDQEVHLKILFNGVTTDYGVDKEGYILTNGVLEGVFKYF